MTNIGVSAPKNAWASCGYQWPVAHQEHVFKLDQYPDLTPKDSGYNICLIDTSDGSKVELHYHILWRTMQTSAVKLAYVTITVPGISYFLIFLFSSVTKYRHTQHGLELSEPPEKHKARNDGERPVIQPAIPTTAQ